MKEFIKSIHKHLGPAATADDFDDEFEEFYTPTFNLNKDKETQKGMIHKTLTNTMELKYYYPQGTP